MTEYDTRRTEAIERLEARRQLRIHVTVYLAVNALLVVVWAATGAGTFWPIWPIAGWGIAVAMHAWQVRGGSGFSEADIRDEMRRQESADRRIP